jgi:cytochrome P450
MSAQPDNPSLLSTADVDPVPFFDHYLANQPVVWDESMKGWLVFSYDLCKHIEEREDLYRHPYADASELLLEIKGGKRNITVLQGDEHMRMHRYLVRLFAPKAIQGYIDEHLKPILDYLFDRLKGRERANLAYEIADQVPPRLFMSLFGLDWKDQELVDRELALHDHVMAWIGGLRTPEATQRARDASRELNEILLPQIRKLQHERGTDMISRLWMEAPGVLDDVTDLDMLAICRELFLAGSDTTVHAIANAYYLLLTQPEVRAAVNADRSTALNNFMEESLRLHGVVQYRFRVANQDGKLGDVNIRRNDLLIPINAAANRDPSRFPNPAQTDLVRPQPRNHLAFNWGPRTCIGAPLARAELREVVTAFLDRLPHARLDPAAPPPTFVNLYTRSYRPLHVILGPSA